jgi:hypothetical protein
MIVLRALPRLLRRTESRRFSGFSFAGPKTLEEILKIDKVAEKSTAELADLWYAYHDEKLGVIGMVTPGPQGRTVIQRAEEW